MSTKTIYTVYKIINVVNNKIYVGVHKQLGNEPLYRYMGSGKIIYRNSTFLRSLGETVICKTYKELGFGIIDI